MKRVVKQLGHIGLRVSDIEASLKYYGELLGLERLFDIKFEIMGKLEKIYYLRMAHGQYLELFDCAGEEVGQFHDRQSFAHLSFEVEDIVASVNEMRKRGVKVYPTHMHARNDVEVPEVFTPLVGKCNSKVAWIKDPDGNLIELMEFTEKSLQKVNDF